MEQDRKGKRHEAHMKTARFDASRFHVDTKKKLYALLRPQQESAWGSFDARAYLLVGIDQFLFHMRVWNCLKWQKYCDNGRKCCKNSLK